MENNIYKKLLEIQKKVKGLSRDKKSYSFSYVTGNKLLSFIKPLMDEQGLILKQEVLSIDNERMDYETKNGSKSEILTKVMMQFTWIDCETGETDINMFGANGQNGFEMGLGSALTYAERYFLLKYFHIATDEDDIDNPERKTIEAVPIDVKRLETRLNACKDLKELQKVYTSLTKAEKLEIETLKDELKEKLTKLKTA